MTPSAVAAPAAEGFLAAFEAVERGASVPGQVSANRRAAFDHLSTIGFPTTKNEDWHYTSVAPLLEHTFAPITARTGPVGRAQLVPFTFGATSWHTAVFVNGRFSPELSDLGRLPRGVRVVDLAGAWTTAPDLAGRVGTVATGRDQAFTALNAAFVYDGLVVDVAQDVHLPDPIHVIFLATADAAGAMTHPRMHVAVGARARATIIESYVSVADACYFTNAVTEVSVGEGATLLHYKIQREAERAFHVGTSEAVQARDSHYVSFSLATGSALSRTNVYTTLAGEGGGATLNGLYMLDGTQHCDHQTRIVHAQPNCFSRELYKGILDGRSHGVFNGKVYVHPIAQKTDGKQTSKTLLLSEHARVDTKPQLEIFADDVKCTHGATVGQIDRTALFYMKSRGIATETARRLLTYAFAADVLETLDVPEVRTTLERVTLERFTGMDATL